jgi:hypothetical protein
VIDRGSWAILGVTSALRLVAPMLDPIVTSESGDMPLGPRAIAVLSGLVAGVALVRAANSIDGPAAGRRAAWMWSVLPLFTDVFTTGSWLAPLYAVVACALLAVVRAVQTEQARWWLAGGAIAGVGAFADWSALLLPLGLALAALGSTSMRAVLTGRAQARALALCLGLAAPALWWRAHLGAQWPLEVEKLSPLLSRGGGSAVERSVAFLISGTLAAGPVLAVLLAAVVIRVLRNGATPARAVLTRWLLAVFVGGGMLALVAHAGLSRAPIAWIAGTVVLSTSALVMERRTWWRAGLLLALAVTLAARMPRQ